MPCANTYSMLQLPNAVSAIYTRYLFYQQHYQNIHQSSWEVCQQDSSPLKFVFLLMMILYYYYYFSHKKCPFVGPNVCNSSSQGTLLAKQKWGWELMFQGERSQCCEFDRWSNWWWGSPLSSLLPPVPRCKVQKLLSNPQKKASAFKAFFAMQPSSLYLFSCFYLPFSFLSQKKVRPAVKCCNPDAVTMFLSANHQRHYLFFNGKKLAPLNSK